MALSILFFVTGSQICLSSNQYSSNNGKKKFEIHFDGQERAEIDDFVSAVSALLAIFWVFSIEFPKCLKNPLTFLALRVSVKIPSKVMNINNSLP